MPSRGERVVTVRGEISPKDLGTTLTHEHLFIDCTFYSHFYPGPTEPRARRLMREPLRMENLWLARRALFSFRDNLVVDDERLITGDLRTYKQVGGSSVVDLTPPSLGGSPESIRRISVATDLNIVSGCGFYIEASQPRSVLKRSVASISEQLISSLEDGYLDTGIRSGVLGEIGTGPEVTSQEKKVLDAVATAHRRTGAPIAIHLANIRAMNGPMVAEALKEKGVKMEKVAMSHMDMKYRNPDHQLKMADYGVFLGFDGFGHEDYVEGLDFLPPRDKERVDNIVFLIEKGFLDQILISHDISRKTSYTKYGGHGFDHILRSVIPTMKRAGVSNKELNTILVQNPARFLAF